MSGSWLPCFSSSDGSQHGLVAYFHHFAVASCGRNMVQTEGGGLLMEFGSNPWRKLVAFIQGVLRGSNHVEHQNHWEQVVWRVTRSRTRYGIATVDRSRLRSTVSELNEQNLCICVSVEGKNKHQKLVRVQTYYGFPCEAEGGRAAKGHITIEQGKTADHIPIVSFPAVVLQGSSNVASSWSVDNPTASSH